MGRPRGSSKLGTCSCGRRDQMAVRVYPADDRTMFGEVAGRSSTVQGG
ncbi:MAG: hypothetical protein AVDCRST_MAG05-3963 [uncultured Rubrobacteraceae bacterium]|uniref:Uncharacterized protein n=1 Tax=uncultured Rubrobacteraceae bacterium TaxID=349277 RepID=A0A6J4TMF2_9ACTN|nr:MAG: hypothetical protein AVDCRST_MAG05-3963 [uncultured Rubrobacteraceae bacterium]